MKQDFIHIQGARENNLKNLSVSIPKKKITVFTGISGSGKSSLVFDTLAAESQRLLNDTYSSYIRHLLQHYGKPDVDTIENLSVTIRIDQKRIEGNARSTVGTITDIYSLLRLLFSRTGQPFAGISSVFSFNNPKGMCPSCEGLGKINTIDFTQLLNLDKSLNEGAIQYPSFEPHSWRWTRYVYSGLFDNDKKLSEYTPEEWNLLLYARIKLKNPDPRYPKSGDYEGLLPRFERSFLKRDSREITGKNAKRFQEIVKKEICPDCNGTRLNPTILNCRIKGKNIADCSSMQIDELLSFIEDIPVQHLIQPVLEALKERLQNMISIGLEYLTLNRETSTISGGESQRIKLVKHLGSSLTDLIYVFDEPSTGLHPSDVHKLNYLLTQLRDKGNTLLIIEHDPNIIALADHIIDIGPGAGTEGGYITFEGNLNELKTSSTLTGKYLSKKVHLKINNRIPQGYYPLSSITYHNLKNLSVEIPKQAISCITGVAGSGKSSFVQAFCSRYPETIFIDQSALRGSKRSHTATYTGIMDTLRKLLAKTNQVSPSLFSSNSEGACPECKGLGIISADLAFMDAVEVCCESCNGSGYNKEALQYKLRGKNIADILSFTVLEALDFFPEPEIHSPLIRLSHTGLGYLKLGQPLNTLSGGERQRLKLASELEKQGLIYIFDEPTTGLHGSDISKLMFLFNQLVDSGKNTVLIIEHNLDVISQADWIIDMGPGAGHKGGQIVFIGYPGDIIKNKDSFTGKYLKKYIS